MSEHDSKEPFVQAVNEMQARETLQAVEPPTGVFIADDAEVRRASEKVFRLHARLFEALAR